MGNTTIKSIFFRYMGTIIIWLLTIFFLMFTSLNIFYNIEFMYPPYVPEQYLETVVKQINETSSIDEITIPDIYEYTLYDESGKVVKSTMREAVQKEFKHYTVEDKGSTGLQQQVSIQPVKYGKLVVTYYLSADFVNSTLRKYLPLGERLHLFISLLLIIIGFFVISNKFVRKIQKELNHLTKATKEIEQMNLDFSFTESSIVEINTVLDSLYQMREALKEALNKQWQSERQLKDSLKAIAHDIKTPVTVIHGNMELLAETDLNEEQKLYRNYAEDHLKRINYYIEELTQLSDLERSKMNESRKEIVTISFLMEKINDLAQSLVAEKNVNIEITANETEKKIAVHLESFIRIVQNILINAIDYTPAGKEIVINSWCEKQELIIEMIDSGKGFSKEALKKAKDRFYTEDSSRSQGKHYGMGLAIAEKMMDAHGGSLEIGNAYLEETVKGGKVTLRMPLI